MTNRFNTLGKKLSEATDDKHRVEISLEDMRHNLIEAQEERSVLGENLSEAQNQIEELMQLNTTGGSGGLARRQSLAPSLATFHTTTFKPYQRRWAPWRRLTRSRWRDSRSRPGRGWTSWGLLVRK